MSLALMDSYNPTVQALQRKNKKLRAENERLKAELADRTELISRLNRELAIYREREKTMGWNQG